MRHVAATQAATVVGACLVTIGVLGCVPGVTSHYGQLAFAGRGSGAKLLGVFQVSILQNLLYIVAGVAGLALGRTDRDALRFLTGGGLAFLLLWLVGVVKAGGWIPMNPSDNWLRLGIGVCLLGLGHIARPLEPAGA
jgi:hypothetical protein